MKPKITKKRSGRYLCIIPEDQTPDDNATEQEWYAYTACGMGATPSEAYHDWVEDGGVMNERAH